MIMDHGLSLSGLLWLWLWPAAACMVADACCDAAALQLLWWIARSLLLCPATQPAQGAAMGVTLLPPPRPHVTAGHPQQYAFAPLTLAWRAAHRRRSAAAASATDATAAAVAGLALPPRLEARPMQGLCA